MGPQSAAPHSSATGSALTRLALALAVRSRPAAATATRVVSPLALAFLLAWAPGCDRTTTNPTQESTVRVNEIMARSQTFLVEDEMGNPVSHDWVELHNAGSVPVNLNGYTLSDNFNRPRKFEFPNGVTIPADGYVLVFVFNESRCRSNCEEDRFDCEAAVAIGTEEPRDCTAEYAACQQECKAPQGFVADFTLTASGETLFLFKDEGDTVVQQLGVLNQVEDTTNGLDPVTGQYGVIYVPTPREANMPVNLKGHRINAPQTSAPADQPGVINFTIDRDLTAPGELEVTVEWTDLGECGDPIPGGALTPTVVERVIPAGGDAVRIDSSRNDASGNDINVEVVTLSYQAILDPAPAGTPRAFRIRAEDTLASVERTDCVLYGYVRPTVVVSEYMPRNASDVFQYINNKGEVVTPRTPPDWIEIYNCGDAPVDMRELGLATEGDVKDQRFRKWLFGEEGHTSTLGPGEYLLVLADQDGGSFRRKYFRPAEPDHFFYSTHFRLDANKASIDEVLLVDARSGIEQVIDRVVLDFTENGGDIAQDFSAARFSDDCEANTLQPGVVTSCPTPERDNQRTCAGRPPRFEQAVRLISASGAHCPADGEEVLLTARVNFDAGTPVEQTFVEVLGIASETTIAPAADQTEARPGMQLFDVTSTLAGQPAGTLVQFELRAVDLRLQALAAQGESDIEFETQHSSRSAPRVAFQYPVAFEASVAHAVLNEVLPGNVETVLPPFQCDADDSECINRQRFPDFAELHNPTGELIDLTGYYLTNEPAAGTPIRFRKRWQFPEGSVIEPGGFLPIYFGPPPDRLPPGVDSYIQVVGFDPACIAEALHLIAPDDPALGANCVVDTLAWDFSDQPALCAGQSVGRACDGCEGEGCVRALATATPGERNPLPTLFNDSYHEVFLLRPPRTERHVCVPEDTEFDLNAIFSVDRNLAELPGTNRGFQSASFFVDAGEGEVEVPVPSFISFPSPPDGYANVRLRATVEPPFGPVVRYRVEATDACGVVHEAGPFSVGTAAGEHPPIAINEINRFHPFPGSDSGRAWIELHNRSGASVDLGGTYLSDDPANPRKVLLPDGTTIPAGGVLLVLTEGRAVEPHVTIDFDWKANSGELLLFDSEARGSCRLDHIEFDFAGLGTSASIGRDPDGTGDVQALVEPSPGENNSTVILFLRGDADADLRISVLDTIRMLDVLLKGGEPPPCESALDANDDGGFDISDPVFLIDFLLGSVLTIPAPFPEPGPCPST